MPDELLTIGELARRAGRRPSSIRYYEQIGVLPEPARVGGQRRYRPDAVRALEVIDTARRAGLSLAEIRAVLGAGPGEADAMPEFRRIAAGRLAAVTAAIERALAVRAWLEHASGCQCPSLGECPLFSGEHDLSA